MDINAPFGFGKIIPLTREHKLKFERAVPMFFRTAQLIPVSSGEFEVAGRDMPVVFASGGTAANVLPVAMCGFKTGENLFVEGDRWADGVYAPAYVRRWPFCMAAVRNEQGVEQDRIVCVEENVVSSEGEPVLEAEGKPSPLWSQYEPLVLEYERDLARTEQLCKLLVDLKLLEGFRLDAEIPGVGQIQVNGLFRVSEAQLKELPADQLRMLIERGGMRLIYAHLASLDRVQLLLNRLAQRSRKAA
ncbi:MAG TPA: SapC family protein [Burkholderiaceae bacterium]|nr:SapC family protein [Burkholderiaceae bacterium]